MKKFIRFLALALIFSMLCATFASCSGKKASDNTNTDAGTNNDATNDSNNNDNTQGDQPSDDTNNPDDNTNNSPYDDGDFDMIREEDVRETQKSAKPNFTEEEIQRQLVAGKELIEKIKLMALNENVDSYTIPAGDYGFTHETQTFASVPSAILLEGIERPDDKPFTINADGVTFWFKTLGRPCGACSRTLHIANSSNIIIKNLTMDAYTADDIEGEVTKIDKENNRVAIKLYDGTMELNTGIINAAMKGSEFRINPIKKNGDAIVPLYNVNNAWGPGSLQLAQSNNLVPTGEEGEYWITFRTDTLLKTIYTEEWLSTYGTQGTLEVGDGICIIFGTSLIMLDNCKQITLDGVKVYSAKTGFWENGGYGNHLYKDCYFGPRPGTNRILGGEGHMSQGVRHGATYDNVTINFTTDDAINIHGFWGRFKSITSNSATMDYVPVGVLKGDTAQILGDDGEVVFTLKVLKTPEATYNYNGFLTSTILFDKEIPSEYASNRVRFPASECDGWVIKNCTFDNIYQRVLINSGSGTIENCKIRNMGSNIALTSNIASYEGGVMGDIVIKDNVILNSTNHPGAVLIPIYQTPEFTDNLSTGKISVKNNLIVACGTLFSTNNAGALVFTDNTIVQPVVYNGQNISFKTFLGNISGAKNNLVRNNVLVGVNYTEDTFGAENCTYPISEELYKKIYEFSDHAQRDAAGVIELVNAKINEAVK